MIKNYKQYNEGINHLLVGPTDEEIWSNYINGELKGLLKKIPKSPEDFFNQMKDDCVEMGSNILGDIYGKNGIKLFQVSSNTEYLHVSYNLIWIILEKVYGFNYRNIQILIKTWLIGDIKWGGLIPIRTML